jgi:hypothetical protein
MILLIWHFSISFGVTPSSFFAFLAAGPTQEIRPTATIIANRIDFIFIRKLYYFFS